MYRPHRDPSPHYLPSSLIFHDTRFPFLVYFHYINRAHSGDRQSLVVCAPYCAVRDRTLQPRSRDPHLNFEDRCKLGNVSDNCPTLRGATSILGNRHAGKLRVQMRMAGPGHKFMRLSLLHRSRRTIRG